jgi:hypothetical protein
VTIIKKIRRKDGSVDCIKQEFYKDYGEDFAQLQSLKFNKELEYYYGSAKAH